MIITLTESELLLASSVGARRQAIAVIRGFADKYGSKRDCAWQNHIEGACGEMAFAKAMGWYWDGGVNTFKRPDVGQVQVRTRSKDDYELIIRKKEFGVYVLVTGLAPKYKIRGWFKSDDVREEWLKDHGGREAAYFIPTDKLYPIETIEVSLRRGY